MKTTIIIAAILFILSYVFEGNAEQQVIRLNCEYLRIQREDETISEYKIPIQLVTVSFSNNQAIIKGPKFDTSDDDPPTFKGTIIDDEIEGTSSEKITSELTMWLGLRINRYTGQMQLVKVYNVTPKLATVYLAICKPAPEPAKKRKF